jgi:two-component sensor histidine kinase
VNLFATAARLRAHPAFGLSFGLGSFLAALGLRFSLNETLPSGFPFLTFFPAVLLSAFFGGLVPGVLCAVLSFLAAWYWFVPPEASFALDLNAAVALGFFGVIIVVDLAIIHTMNTAMDRLRHERDLNASLLDDRRTMFAELQHRVANNLAFVASLLSLQARSLPAGDQARQAFEDTRYRLDAMAKMHRRLYDPDNTSLPLGEFVHTLGNELLHGAGRDDVRFEVEFDPSLTFSHQQMMNIALVTIELMTNAIKHAFPAGRRGTIRATLAQIGDEVELAVSDDGVGMNTSGAPPLSGQLGQRILASFARSLNGSIHYESREGTTARLIMPLR